MVEFGYCEVEDVGAVLQSDFAGANPATDEVKAAIRGQSEYVDRRTRAYFYDSNASASDLTPNSPRETSGVRLDVPSSPHRHDRQLYQQEVGVRYPVTHSGPYCRIRLPHLGVEELAGLEVRDRGGDVVDWTTDPEFIEGRGEDYYLHTDGDEYERAHLYVRGASIGARVDYDDLLTVSYTYGYDAVDRSWQSVRRAVALRAAAELVIDDEFEAALPGDSPAVSVSTKADQYEDRAADLLEPYMSQPI